MSAKHNLETTIVAPATPLNQASALGIIRLSGSIALTIANQITGKSKFKPRFMHLCSLRNNQGKIVDQGLVVYFPGPMSSTGEDVVEFHVHGNPLILSSILKASCAYGAVVAQPGEFLYRAFWYGKYDITQIEGIASLINGRTNQALISGVAAISGLASERLRQYAAQISAFRCQIESAIDFSDQDDVQNHLVELCAEKLTIWTQSLQSDLELMRSRLHSSQGCDLILVGPPNAGKSSLLNILADEEVSIVDYRPGTTRDLVKKQIAIQGVPITLCDTAGLRKTNSRIENKGIEKAHHAMGQVSAIVYVNPDGAPLDLSLIPQWDSLKVKKYLLLNKIDKNNGIPGRRENKLGFDAVFGLSLKTGSGLEDWFKTFEKDFLGSHNEESVWLANARQDQHLQSALDCSKKALSQIYQIEIAAEYLKEAHEALGRITGNYSHDDLLSDVFSKFCIGK